MKNILFSLSLLLFSLNAFGCQSDEKDGTVDNEKGNTEIDKDSLEQCDALVNFEETVESIETAPREFVRTYASKDQCLLGVVDTLSEKYIAKSESKYLYCLINLFSVSDGYLSDYLDGTGSILFKEKFPEFFNYVYEARDRKGKYPEDFLIYSVSDRMYGFPDDEYKEEYEALFGKWLNGSELDNSKKEYLKELKGKIDERGRTVYND